MLRRGSVMAAAYHAHPTATAPFPTDTAPRHRCGSCHAVAPVTRAATVLSHGFSTWDDIAPDRGARWLCEHCAWAYKERIFRTRPAIITTAPSLTWATRSELRTALTRPIPADTAIIVPLGNRSIGPTAQWGHLTTSFGTIPWTPNHHLYLALTARLRALGATEATLADTIPPPAVLNRTSPTDHQSIRRAWRELDPARNDPHLLSLLLTLTRTDTPTKGAA